MAKAWLEWMALIAWAATAMAAHASPRQIDGRVVACLQAAAVKHGVSAELLTAIAAQESGFNPRAVSAPNTNGSVDYGLMQVNSAWLPTLARWGITRESLMDACISADVGAWILADNIRRYGLTWNAVGAYNAATDWKRARYASAIAARLRAPQTSVRSSTSLSAAQHAALGVVEVNP